MREKKLYLLFRYRHGELELPLGEADRSPEAATLLGSRHVRVAGHLEHLLGLAPLLRGVGHLLGESVGEVIPLDVVEVDEDALLAAEAGERGVAGDLRDVEEGAGREVLPLAFGVEGEGEADDGAVEGLVELEPAHDAGRAADGVYGLPFCGHDYVALRGTHRVSALGGDHTRLHAPLRYGGGDAAPDALRKVEPAGLSHQPQNLSKKRAK